PIEETQSGPESDRRASLHAALRFAAGFYFNQLKTDAGARGLAYLQERGFSKETVVAFGIGVAPAGWDTFVSAAMAEGFKPDVLEAVGLAKTRESGGVYDVFRDRLMFPILSPIGKVLGFGGRILPDSDQGSADYTPAKYINTPETEVYHKSRVLYGLKQSKRSIRAEEEAIVVEGYADVVSLHQAGVTNMVAASGTALTPQQVDLLAQTARSIVLLFDADSAGQSAARKGVDVALDAGLSPYAVTLPDGADPDSFVRQFGADAFRRFLAEERRDFVTFLVESAQRAGELDTPEGKSASARGILAAIRRVKDSIQANEYLRRAADELGVYESDLRREFDRMQGRPKRRASGPQRVDLAPEPRIPDVPEPEVVVVRPDEEQLIALMLLHGTEMVEHVLTRMGLDEFTPGGAQETVQALIQQYESRAVDRGPFVRGDFGERVRALATQALAERYETSERYEDKGLKRPEKDDPHAVANSAMQLLKLARVQEAIESAARRQQATEQRGEDATGVMHEIMALHDLRRQIEQGAFLEWGEESADDGS
ncbi:MAG: toprim domain-containing protein, partial [Bacteroidota bacterium]